MKIRTLILVCVTNLSGIQSLLATDFPKVIPDKMRESVSELRLEIENLCFDSNSIIAAHLQEEVESKSESDRSKLIAELRSQHLSTIALKANTLELTINKLADSSLLSSESMFENRIAAACPEIAPSAYVQKLEQKLSMGKKGEGK